MKPYSITLNESEIRIAKWLAKMRFHNNRQSSIMDKKIGKQSAEETDLNGIGAEMAFCKLVNVYPDFTID